MRFQDVKSVTIAFTIRFLAAFIVIVAFLFLIHLTDRLGDSTSIEDGRISDQTVERMCEPCKEPLNSPQKPLFP